MITAAELAQIENCSERWIRKKAQGGAYKFTVVRNDLNREVYMFPVSDLSKEIQEKYMATQIEIAREANPDKDILSLDERKEIDFWKEVLLDWRKQRNYSPKNFEEFDEAFVTMMKTKHPDIAFSRRILYKKWGFLKMGDLKSLIDHRGKQNKGRTKVTDEMRNAYLFYYMDEAQHSQAKCYEYMKMAIAESYPEQYNDIPCYKTMQRDLINSLPYKLRVLAREGRKAYDDICAYHVRRTYENMKSNDFWIGDTHTLDVMSMDEEGKVHRLYLNAWMDARSGVMVGWHITANPNSQATIYSLRDAIIRRNAIPLNVYVDNGREYLTKDVGGLGHRARKKKKDEFQAPPIFSRLGIHMVNALPTNARAKTIERRFLDFKESVSKLFSTYTGGSVAEKPEVLKTRLKNKEIVIDNVLKAKVNTIIEHYFNYSVYNGAVKEDRGKRKIDIYNKNQTMVRRASEADLDLMLMRSSRALKVGRRGLSLKLYGEVFDYNSYELHNLWGTEVYYRYDPDDLSHIKVYDIEDRYLMDVPCADETVLEYGASQADIKNAMQIINEYRKKDFARLKEIRGMKIKDALSLVLLEAEKNKKNPAEAADPKVIQVHRAVESEALMVANGVPEINLDVMLKNIRKRESESNE